MKALILSDNHYQAITVLGEFDYIFHCGDYGNELDYLIDNKAFYVRGNCDSKGPKELECYADNKKIYITHGDLYNNKMTYNSLMYKALSVGCNICMFGHTHYQHAFTRDNILYINPGSYMEGDYAIIDNDFLYLYHYDEVVNKIKI